MKILKLTSRTVFAATMFLLAVVSISAQDDTNSRSITSQDFQTQRKGGEKSGTGMKAATTTTPGKPVNARRKKNIAVISSSKRKYDLVKKIPSKSALAVNKIDKNKPPVTVKSTNAKTFRNEELGVTFWRLRPRNDDEEDAPTFSVKVDKQIEKWTAERVNSTTRFQKGDRVRFTIESSRSGYIYVVNREVYADGTTGQAEIIFPTLKTRAGGDNKVTAGSVIEIPGSEVQYSYFNINPKRDDYAGEELVIIITPKPFTDIEIGMKAAAIREEIVQKWLEDWLGDVDIFDAADGEGIAYTQAEAQAATTNSRALTQEEPLPQTIYRVRIDTNSPLVVPFQMQAKP